MTTLREDLKAWRQRLGITQAKAAEMLEVPLPTYRGWEGGRYFDRERILRLAISQIEYFAKLPRKTKDAKSRVLTTEGDET